MPALTSPQLALLRRQDHRSTWYLYPIVPDTVFSAQINSASITVGANTIPFDNVTAGAYTDIKAGMTLWVGTAPNTYNVARIRVRSATAAHIVVAENSDVAWADNYYLTVKQEYLCWSVRQFINAGVVYKDFDIAYANQTNPWGPVALMGDNACKLFSANPTPVYFDGSESYAVQAGATITAHAWDFDDGGSSSATTPGNHNYAAAGVYFPTETVTDSNGKTHLTRRIAALPTIDQVYTAFQCDSLDGEIDGGWTAQFTVSGVSDVSEFPERAPIFFFADDSYGATDGSVGYPRGRENIVLFGYIQESSVSLNPETSVCTFSVESLAGQMARSLPTPAAVHDATSPAAWDEGKDLNIFRTLVYFLKFQSTVMDIADVSLYNDTTRIKYSDFPEDNLWNMLAQFAHGSRLMRAGVSRTGRLMVKRDPNLIPVVGRSAVVTVCQLEAGDWQTEVTIPQAPFPVTCFLCLAGIGYDGNPAHDPDQLYGMSPGHPPKEYGQTREVTGLALVDQTDANNFAGLLVGQDNNIYGPVVIPMAGNWSRVFDPARQEYVQAPIDGFPNQRGQYMLSNQFMIVRGVAITFDWEAGTTLSQLTCEVYSYQEVSTVGDCFDPESPLPPEPAPPPPPPPPPPLPVAPPQLSSWNPACVAAVSSNYLYWTSVGSGSPHYLERSTSPFSGFSVIFTDTTNLQAYVDTAITPGVTYYYRIRAKIGLYYTVYGTTRSILALMCTPVLSISNTSCQIIKLDWTNVSGENGFEIWRERVGVPYAYYLTVGANVLTYSDNPTPADHYYYKVRAVNTHVNGAFSNEEDAEGGHGTVTFPQHVYAALESGVWETFDFGGADYCQPTWTNITGVLPGGGFTQWDGVDTLKIIAGSGITTMAYSRSISGGGAWTPFSSSNQQYARDNAFWQNIYDPLGLGSPGTDARCNVRYYWNNQLFFINFVGQNIHFGNNPGPGMVGHAEAIDCTPICLKLPKVGSYLNDGESPIFTAPNYVSAMQSAPHKSKHPNEPTYTVLNVLGISTVYIIYSYGSNHTYTLISGPPCVYDAHDIDSGIIRSTATYAYWHADPGNSNILWLCEYGSDRLYKSVDGGVTRTDMGVNTYGGWSSLDLQYPASGVADTVRICSNANYNSIQMKKSVDGGANWTTINGITMGSAYKPGEVGLFTVKGFPNCLLAHSGYHGGGIWNSAILCSEDDGLHWFDKYGNLPGGAGNHAIDLFADPNS